MLATNASPKLPSSEYLFDPSGDRLGLGNCTTEKDIHCPQCGDCCCEVVNVAHLPDLTKLVEERTTTGCPLHDDGVAHPMYDVYDEPHLIKQILAENQPYVKGLSWDDPNSDPIGDIKAVAARFQLEAGGGMTWGDGIAARDPSLSRRR